MKPSVMSVMLAVLAATAVPAAVQAWDFIFDGTNTFQNLNGTPAGAVQYTAAGNGDNWDSTTTGDWGTETVVLGGGALEPAAGPSYLSRLELNTAADPRMCGLNLALNSAATQWNSPGGMLSTPDPTHNFTMMFRIRNLGCGKRADATTWSGVTKPFLEIGTDQCMTSTKDHMFAIAQKASIGLGQGVEWKFNSNAESRNGESGEYVRAAEADFETYRLVGYSGLRASDNWEFLWLDLYKWNPDTRQEELVRGQFYKFAGSGLKYFKDIRFRFNKTYATEQQGYDVDWVAIEIGNAWHPGQGDAPLAMPEPVTLVLLGLGGPLIRRKRVR